MSINPFTYTFVTASEINPLFAKRLLKTPAPHYIQRFTTPAPRRVLFDAPEKMAVRFLAPVWFPLRCLSREQSIIRIDYFRSFVICFDGEHQPEKFLRQFQDAGRIAHVGDGGIQNNRFAIRTVAYDGKLRALSVGYEILFIVIFKLTKFRAAFIREIEPGRALARRHQRHASVDYDLGAAPVHLHQLHEIQFGRKRDGLGEDFHFIKRI